MVRLRLMNYHFDRYEFNRNHIVKIIVIPCDVICNGMLDAIHVRLNGSYKTGCIQEIK